MRRCGPARLDSLSMMGRSTCSRAAAWSGPLRSLAAAGAVALAATVAAAALARGGAAPGRSAGEAGAGRSPLDVLLVTIDTLRADAPGFGGRRPSPTPLLDRLAAGGRAFTAAHAHNVVTLPSHTNILTGLYPFQHGVRDNEGFRLPAGVPTLAAVLH